MAFVRVKRRHDEDPFNSIIVSHKKLKTAGIDFSRDCVFQFAATIKDEVSSIAPAISGCFLTWRHVLISTSSRVSNTRLIYLVFLSINR